MVWIIYEVGNADRILDGASGGGRSWIMYMNGGRNVGVCQHAAQERHKSGTSVSRYLRTSGQQRRSTPGGTSAGTPVRTSSCACVLYFTQGCSKARTATLENMPSSEVFHLRIN